MPASSVSRVDTFMVLAKYEINEVAVGSWWEVSPWLKPFAKSSPAMLLLSNIVIFQGLWTASALLQKLACEVWACQCTIH